MTVGGELPQHITTTTLPNMLLYSQKTLITQNMLHSTGIINSCLFFHTKGYQPI
jgi:hypothetical protein